MSCHLSRDLFPKRDQWRLISRVILAHLTLQLRRGEDASRYNVIQRLAYVAVVLVLAPLAILTGATMSPAIDAAAPWLLDVFGGRQSARTLHFIVAALLVVFVFVHIVMVVLSGFFTNVRAMITGWYSLKGRASNYDTE